MRIDPPAPPLTDSQVSAALGLSLGIAELVLASGVPSADAASTLTAVAVASGIPRQQVSVDVTLNTLIVTITRDGDSPPFSRVVAVSGRALDYTRLTRLYRLVDDLVSGRVSSDDGQRVLQAITDASPPFPTRVAELGTAGLAGAVVAAIGGSLPGVAIAAAITLLTLRVIEFAERRGLPRFFANVAAGALVTAVAVLAVSLGAPVRPSFIVAGGIVALLPAIEILAAVSDALSGYVVTAAGRFVEVLFFASGIAAGVVFVLNIAVRYGVNVRVFAVEESTAEPIVRLVAGALASALFLLGVSGPWRLMPCAGLVGGVGVAATLALAGIDVVGVTALASAAVLIGTIAVLLGRRLRVPALVLTVPGFIPLLPGLALYDGMFQISRGNTSIGITVLVGAVSGAVALASGVVLGDVISARARHWRTRFAAPWRTQAFSRRR